MVEMIGRPIGHWILERVLKPGGMGGVFLARHATLGTPAAVKILTRNAVPGAEAHERLRHPHVVRVHDSLEEAGVRFLVLEYLPGGSLAERLEEGTPPPAQAVRWIRQALAGLGHVHARGVVHRDVKPGNLMLDARGRVKVVDFGIAGAPAGTRRGSGATTLGTVQYASPEQLEGLDQADHRSDLYAAGAVLYELLAGEPPFAGTGLSQVLRTRLLAPEPPPVDRIAPAVEPGLAAVVHRCLAVDREERHQSAGELRRALLPFLAGSGRVYGERGKRARRTASWGRPRSGVHPVAEGFRRPGTAAR